MEWNIEFVKVDNYIKITTIGVFSIEQHPKLFQNLLTHKNWKAGTPILFDNRRFDFGPINTNKLRTASNHYQQFSQQLGNGKVALLMKSPADFGYGRQFEMLSEGKGELEICVFRDEVKSIEWLLNIEAMLSAFHLFY